jgi:hypothetical protein
MGQRRPRHHGNGGEGDAGVAQPLHTGHHPVVRAAAVAADTLRVVKKLWPVDADANAHRMALEEAAPALVDEHGIGLEMVAHRVAAGMAGHTCEGLFVPRRFDYRRLAGMPDDAQRRARQRRGEDLAQGGLEHLGAHAPAVGAVGQVAVAAIEVAEGCRLQDQQTQSAAPAIGHAAQTFFQFDQLSQRVTLGADGDPGFVGAAASSAARISCRRSMGWTGCAADSSGAAPATTAAPCSRYFLALVLRLSFMICSSTPTHHTRPDVTIGHRCCMPNRAV